MAAAARPFNPNDFPVVIGIDFGTTFSGCSYAFIQNDEVIDIVRWPKQNNNVYPKTPTLNFYHGNSDQMTQWGNAARLEMQRPTARNSVLLKQYKLYLDENIAKDLPPLPNGLTIVDAIADYLRAFHDHVVNELKKGFARNYGQHQFRYCLTVPAMWSDKAKSTMREAAIKAGLINEDDHRDRLTLISEPEAAALYCEKKCDQFNLRHGDRFMICDAGGGTVDLIVFEIDEHGGRKLRECTKGHGQSCGSVFLDRRMRKLLKKKFKEYLSSIPASAFETMMDTFVDLIKPQFDGIDDQFISLPASMNLDSLNKPEIGLEDGTLCITAAELKQEVFEPVIREVLALVEDQLIKAQSLQAVFLVGGFGSSNYLFERVQQEFAPRVGLVAVPPRCELAVVRGAVYFGLNPHVVTTRIPRYWYGIDTTTTFEEGIDPPSYKIIRADGSVRCDNRFSVYVRRGEALDIDNCVSKDFFAYYPHHTTCTLYAADTEEQPRYTTSPGVRKVANFTIPMPTLPGVMEGEKVDLSIKMYFGEVELRVEAVIRGKTYGTTCTFDSD
ncbi:actin-like ATPase domain-containing protein [Lichtheimia hyalospora FSU 10163]|nr:actin-like ATPase domain-containing protein [Lichtheimia hyalospora FSU 10163]